MHPVFTATRTSYHGTLVKLVFVVMHTCYAIQDECEFSFKRSILLIGSKLIRRSPWFQASKTLILFYSPAVNGTAEKLALHQVALTLSYSSPASSPPSLPTRPGSLIRINPSLEAFVVMIE